MFKITETPISGLNLVENKTHADSRGTFARLFCEEMLASILNGRHIVQINRSTTHLAGAVRGMHFQHPPHAEMKFVRCLRGRVFDVAVDLRKGSPTFLNWYGVELSADKQLVFAIPEGIAHGFQVLEKDSELLYLHTAAYVAHAEGSIAHNDPRIAIKWPHAVTQVSARDKSHPPLDDHFQGLTI